jgi:hypothetical protein
MLPAPGIRSGVGKSIEIKRINRPGGRVTTALVNINLRGINPLIGVVEPAGAAGGLAAVV